MYPVRILGIAPYLGLERIMQQLAAQRPEIQLITSATTQTCIRRSCSSNRRVVT